MINVLQLLEIEKTNGYTAMNASAKVCQDLILKALSKSSFSRNVTIKGGVVMRSKTNNIRRATQDIDIDFIKYPLTDTAIKDFICNLNCVEGICFKRIGSIEELKQQDYHGKRVYLQIEDMRGNILKSKIDLGVHKHFEIEQEEYSFDVALNNDAVSLLINSNEQMMVEKLRSLLKFGSISTRFKDVFDIYFLMSNMNEERLEICLKSLIFQDKGMRENCIDDIVQRLTNTFDDKQYRKRINETNKKWIDEDIEIIAMKIIDFFKNLE